MKTKSTSSPVGSQTELSYKGPLLVAAVIYVVAWIVGLVIAFGYPAADASGATWITFLKGNQGLVILQEYLIHGVAAIALIVFAAGVYAFLRQQAADRFLPSLVLLGAAAAASVSLVQATVGQVTADKASATGDQPLVVTLLAIDNQADTFKLLGLALLVAAATVGLWRVGAVASWVRWGGLATAALLLLGSWSFPLNSAALGIALDLSLLALLAWVLTVAILLFRRESPAAATAS